MEPFTALSSDCARPAAQRHVGNHRPAQRLLLCRYEIDAGDHAGVAAVAITIQHAHSPQGHVLRHTVGGAAHGAGNVRAVAVAVDAVAAEGVVAEDRPAAELRVTVQDARVDDIRRDARTSLIVGVRAVERQRSLVNAVESPGSAVLRAACPHLLIGLDVGHQRIAQDALHCRLGQGGGEAMQRRV